MKEGCRSGLREAIARGTLGKGSVAEGEYLRNMSEACVFPDETVRWVEVCYCPTPLLEERPYWEEYFELVKVQDAHDRRKCRDENGSEPWACGNCDCTARLEAKLKSAGESFLDTLQGAGEHASKGEADSSRENRAMEKRPSCPQAGAFGGPNAQEKAVGLLRSARSE
jgi:hypothetical protein